MASLSKSTTLATALDRSSFRRLKKQSLREGTIVFLVLTCMYFIVARQTEKQERMVRGEKDKRERQKHLDYVTSIMTHGRDFMNFHRTNIVRNRL